MEKEKNQERPKEVNTETVTSEFDLSLEEQVIKYICCIDERVN